ncbi:MAG: hypothetical protein HZB46_09130 [Solirubrobacterales bacterium]|nr:hypothetical protein [Solirubrobacterales bacterium]
MASFLFEGHRAFSTREGAGDPIVFLPNATLTGRLSAVSGRVLKATNDVIVVDVALVGNFAGRLRRPPSAAASRAPLAETATVSR